MNVLTVVEQPLCQFRFLMSKKLLSELRNPASLLPLYCLFCNPVLSTSCIRNLDPRHVLRMTQRLSAQMMLC